MTSLIRQWGTGNQQLWNIAGSGALAEFHVFRNVFAGPWLGEFFVDGTGADKTRCVAANFVGSPPACGCKQPSVNLCESLRLNVPQRDGDSGGFSGMRVPRVFAVHGAGGVIGTILVAFLAHDSLGGAGYASGMDAISQLVAQLTGVVSVLVWSVVGTIVIALIIKQTIGLRVDSKEEDQGLDMSAHGETNQ